MSKKIAQPPESARGIEISTENLISFREAVEKGYEGSLIEYIDEASMVYYEAMKK